MSKGIAPVMYGPEKPWWLERCIYCGCGRGVSWHTKVQCMNAEYR